VERQGVGIPGRDGLLHQIKLPKDHFRVAIRRTVPCFVPHFRDGPVSKGIYEEKLFATGLRSADSSDTAASDPEPPPPPPPPPPYTYPPFLVGEEDSDEIGLNDGEEIFIDDVLETANWCVPWLCGVNLTHIKPPDQRGHTRATKQLSFHSPEGVYPCLRRPMGRALTNSVQNYCREGKRSHFAHRRHPFRELRPHPF
jgi:hypothetical protein